MNFAAKERKEHEENRLGSLCSLRSFAAKFYLTFAILRDRTTEFAEKGNLKSEHFRNLNMARIGHCRQNIFIFKKRIIRQNLPVARSVA